MKDIVQSVDRALSILEVLSENSSGLGITEISKKIDLHKSTVHRLLSTLIYKDYVEQDHETNKYRITLKVLELGNNRLKDLDIVTVSRPHLTELMKKTNEVVHLVILEKEEIVYIDKVESENTIRMHSTIGKRSPAYCTAVGKAIMSHMTMEEVLEIWNNSQIKEHTQYTITGVDEMKEELKKIRERGYSVDDEENEIGVRCVAAPIFNWKGDVIAAISISGPTMRVTKEKVEEFSILIIEYARRISLELGYNNK
ncbi:IclR family transcriptional regulator [Clostridiisalibacter paucivorans]|uniref:IclR family transcriptional regulator n=1 Tax=Clostridiisalibacter paucivorans TaxID=408753 RepID=UPI00047DDDD7|nr:IclR family transcriptional regulator [Clostridiisalibacter paucivorans]